MLGNNDNTNPVHKIQRRFVKTNTTMNKIRIGIRIKIRIIAGIICAPQSYENLNPLILTAGEDVLTYYGKMSTQK